jgi:hypothetical protein
MSQATKVELPGFARALQMKGWKTYEFEDFLKRHLGETPRGYKTYPYAARNGHAVPMAFVEHAAEVLKVDVETLMRVPEFSAKLNGEKYVPYAGDIGQEVVPDPSQDLDLTREGLAAIDCRQCTKKQCFEHWQWLLEHRPELAITMKTRANCAVEHERLVFTPPRPIDREELAEMAGSKTLRRRRRKKS